MGQCEKSAGRQNWAMQGGKPGKGDGWEPDSGAMEVEGAGLRGERVGATPRIGETELLLWGELFSSGVS